MIDRLPLNRIWGFLRNWQKNPPLHRLAAIFLEYGKGSGDAVTPATRQGFEVTPAMMDAFGGRNRRMCRQAQLDARTRKHVEEFQSTPAYQEFRKNWRSKLNPKVNDGG